MTPGSASAVAARAPSRDFWLSCGHHLLDRSEGGGLLVTDAFLQAYLARPELVPPPDTCLVERTLHAALLGDPRRTVAPSIVEEIADPDARENWRAMLDFRDRLTGAPTLEAAYIDLVRHGIGRTPPIFLNQLVHAILRNALDDCTDPFVLRAAELFFRAQRLTLHGGALIAADEELVAGANARPASPLVAMLGQPAEHVDVMNEENCETYWERSDRFDMALDLTAGRRGPAALADVIRRWIAHLLALDVEVEPLVELKDAKLTWYVGLDARGTAVGDALWRGEPLEDAEQSRIAGLLRLSFTNESSVLPQAKGEPVYLIMAMAPDMTLRLKPQNLVTGLPLIGLEAVA